MNCTYEEFINNILETRGRFACGDEYHEKHHIVPKCMGGTNDEENLIDLFAREHFQAHRLLALENPEVPSVIYAWWNMSHTNKANQRDYEITADEYEEARKEFCRLFSGKNHPMFGKRGELSPMYGKHLTEKTKEKISQKAKNRMRSKNNVPFYGKCHTEDTKQYLSDVAIARWKNEKYRENIINKLIGLNIGEKHWNFGKHLSNETKNKISKTRINNKCAVGKNNPKARKVIRLSDLTIYGCMNEASINNAICRSTMRKYCKEHKDFMYYEEWLVKQNKFKGEDVYEI